jgi:hypothetical protein
MEITIVYTGDSRNFHIFAVANEESEVVGTLYFSKNLDLPEGLDVNIITPQRDHFLWERKIKFLLEKSREGSKNRKRLTQVLKEYSSTQSEK